jgi:2-pyrone-4,6-dicarboxylate lactonase
MDVDRGVLAHAPALRPPSIPTIGGALETNVKHENGARFTTPVTSRVVTQAIGRGTTMPVSRRQVASGARLSAAICIKNLQGGLRRLTGPRVRGARISRAGLGITLTPAEQARALARVKELGWYVKVQPEPSGLAEQRAAFEGLDVPVPMDHMGRVDVTAGDADPGLARVLELLRRDNVWVMLSLSEKISKTGFPWDDVVPLARRLIETAPERCFWGSDWPHPVSVKQPPNEGALMELRYRFAPDPATRHKILVDNPSRFFGFDT